MCSLIMILVDPGGDVERLVNPIFGGKFYECST